MCVGEKNLQIRKKIDKLKKKVYGNWKKESHGGYSADGEGFMMIKKGEKRNLMIEKRKRIRNGGKC
jgi:hypothetical protein